MRGAVGQNLVEKGRGKDNVPYGSVAGLQHDQSRIGSSLVGEVEGVDTVGGWLCAEEVAVLRRVDD